MRDEEQIDSENPRLDLRSGRSVWELDNLELTPSSSQKCPHKADILIVGAGITGSFLAERLTRLGRSVVVVDRHRPQKASTAASTALLQWEIDTPLLELETQLGFEAASFVYRRSFAAVGSIGHLVKSLDIQADFKPRRTLYLAGNRLDATALGEEHRLREKAGLAGTFLNRDQLLASFGFDREAAILSPGSAEANPMRLAKALLDKAIERGAEIFHPVAIKDYDSSARCAHVVTDHGFEIEANIVILANGYEMPGFIPSTQHSLASTWALATVPQLPTNLWAEGALIWEASEPYTYLRTTPDNRIVIGGEDEDLIDEKRRDEKIEMKTSVLLQKLSALVPGANLKVDAAWAGFFGQTNDGLPLIGAIPGKPHYYAAFGYGGNGITFSALAADLIASLILEAGLNHGAGLNLGERDQLCDLFSIAR